MAEEVTIVIPGLLITFKSATWGARQKEQYLEVQQAITAPRQHTRDLNKQVGFRFSL